MTESSSIPYEEFQKESLLVWDAEETPKPDSGLTVLWRHAVAADSENQVSIAQMVEDRAEVLRSRYLAWLYNFGESRVDGRRVIDHLAIRPGLSFWWMTSLAQQFNLGSHSGINDTLKALALEELINEHPVSTLRIHSPNRALVACMADLCHTRSITFVSSCPDTGTYRRFLDYFPALTRAFFYLVLYWLKALPMLMRRPISPVKGDVLFMDVLVHLDKQALDEGRFGSNYWTDLVCKLNEWKVTCLWGHLFFRYPEIRTLSSANRLLTLFNRNALPGQGHFLLEAYLRPAQILAVLRDYWRISCAARRLEVLKRPAVPGSVIDPWPLHLTEWRDSLCGIEAARNCLRIVLFEAAMTSLPKKRIGFYIYENQPWELAFLYAWRAAGHGELNGVPHTTVRFWDLRYHRDPRCYEPDPSGLGMPLPEHLAVNGSLAKKSLLTGGYPQARLFDAEALRFLHLQAQPGPRRSRPKNLGLRVLVCGDFRIDHNKRLFSWLETAAELLPSDTSYLFKPHPAYPIEQQHYLSLSLEVREEPIHSLLDECDVVFASNSTSAAVDAFCAGIPVVQMMDGSTFNLSPLRGQPGVIYARSPEALTRALSQAEALEGSLLKLFNFNTGLVLWRRLLLTDR